MRSRTLAWVLVAGLPLAVAVISRTSDAADPPAVRRRPAVTAQDVRAAAARIAAREAAAKALAAKAAQPAAKMETAPASSAAKTPAKPDPGKTAATPTPTPPKPEPPAKIKSPADKVPLPKADADVAGKVNALLKSEIAGAPDAIAQARDEVYLRRVALDITGVPPTAAETTAFVLDSSPNKRAAIVERLLAKDAYGQNWGRYWRDVIMYRRTDERALLVSNPLQTYLATNLNKNTPWDELARSFMTAVGDIREEGDTGLIMAQMGDTEDVTAEVSRIFMGVQISCAQCHDHPTDRWKREQFHQLAAFFPRIAVRPVRDGEQRSFMVVSADRGPRSAAMNANFPRGSQEHYMPDLDRPTDRGKLIQPAFFLTGQKYETGKVDADRRSTAATWITSPKNPWFAKAIVNRLWSELVGEGFYEPVDDMGPDRECSAPKTLDYLAEQFVAHRHDVKWLLTTIMSTDAYQRESRSRRNPDGQPFASNCAQRLRGDQLYSALMVALGIDDSARGGGGRFGAVRSPRGAFNAAFGYDPSTRRDEVTGSIPQALLLMNSQQVNRAIDGRSRFTALGSLLAKQSNNETVITELYLRTLAREPKPSEVQTCLAHVQKTGSRVEAFEDVLWALINGTEFLHRR